MSGLAFVQAATPITGAAGTSPTIVYNSPSVSGNLLIFVAVTGISSVTSVTATSSSTAAAITYGAATGGGSPPYAGMWYAVAGASTTVTWTVNLPTGTGGVGILLAYEYSGNTGTPFDKATAWAVSSVVGTAATTSASSPANANELAISLLMLGEQNTYSALAFGGGYSQRGSTVIQTGDWDASYADQVLSGSPSTTASATWTGTGNHWGIAQALFIPIPAAAGSGSLIGPRGAFGIGKMGLRS